MNGKLLQAVPTGSRFGYGRQIDNQSNAAAAAVCNVYVYVLYLALSPKFDSLTDAAHTHRMLAWGKMENTKCIYICMYVERMGPSEKQKRSMYGTSHWWQEASRSKTRCDTFDAGTIPLHRHRTGI